MNKLNVGAYYGGFGGSLLGAAWTYFIPNYMVEPRKGFRINDLKENFPQLTIDREPDLQFLGLMDLVWGSPPCAQFSSLGVKRKDFGKLDSIKPQEFDYYKFLKTMKEANVKTFVLENVPKVLKYFNFEDDGFITFLGTRCLDMSEYKFQIIQIDANDCGVPQKRKRAYILGSKVFEPNFIFTDKQKNWIQTVFKATNPHYVGKIIKDILPIEQSNKDLPNHSEMRVKGFSGLKPGQSYYGTQNNRRLFWDRPSFTITSHCTRHVHPEEPRVLSVKECAKIMGFPDNYIFTGSESNKLDQIGKGIVPQVAYLISSYIYYELQKIIRES